MTLKIPKSTFRKSSIFQYFDYFQYENFIRIHVAGIKSDYNIGRYNNPSRTIEAYRVLTDNGSLNLEIDYADYKASELA